jgi:hypothetical protein
LATSLFAAPQTLAVGGIAELMLLETMSALLVEKGRPGLAKQWSVTPVGGAQTLAAFMALVATAGGHSAGPQRSAIAPPPRNLAVLMELSPNDVFAAEAAVRKVLFANNRILTYADFTHGREAGIEDMFEVEAYLRLVNEEYRLGEASPPLHGLSLPPGGGIVRRIEAHLAQHPLPGKQLFRRDRPARYLVENLAALGPAISPATLARFETLFEQLNKML